MRVDSHSLDVMARTVWAEARSEPLKGQIAVAWVIRNRAEKGGWWGDTVEKVCMKPWQFSCWNDDDPQAGRIRTVTLDDPTLQRAQGVCALVLSDDLPDSSGNATHYYADYIQEPTWARKMTRTVVIGRHIFLR